MNVHTEVEARTKWCPFARTHKRYENGPLAIEQSDDDARCKASGCACWRWESFASRDNPTREPGAGQSFDATRGYCGLAGAP